MSDTFDKLRKRAEKLVQHHQEKDFQNVGDALSLIQELQIHQTELELQNEELRRAQEEISSLYRQYEDLYEFAPCGYLSLDAKGIITRINLTGVKLLNNPRKGILKTGFSRY